MRSLVAVLATVVVVMVVEVAKGMPLKPEPRKFVYQPGSPSVRLYPVHFEHYLNSSSGHMQLLKEGSLVLQGFRPNMLQPKIGKTERPSDMAVRVTTPMMPEAEIQPMITTVPTTTSLPTTPEPKRVSTTTARPTTTTEAMTTLQPEAMAEAEEESVQPHTDAPSHDLEDAEPVTEARMVLEEDSLAPPSDGEEAASATETMLLMEEEDIQAVTEVSYDGTEAIPDGNEVADDVTVTEPVPENEVTTEFPTFRETEVV